LRKNRLVLKILQITPFVLKLRPLHYYPPTMKCKIFFGIFLLIVCAKGSNAQTDAYNNRINWQDCVEVTYWDRDYLACGRDRSNYPNCRAIKFKNKCKETIYVTLYWITSDGTRRKHGSGTFQSGSGEQVGGWWTTDAVAYEFEVGPPNESNGIVFPSSNTSINTNNTASLTSEQLQQQQEEEARKRKLEEQRKLQEYKQKQLKQHDQAYKSNNSGQGYSSQNQQTGQNQQTQQQIDMVTAEYFKKQEEINRLNKEKQQQINQIYDNASNTVGNYLTQQQIWKEEAAERKAEEEARAREEEERKKEEAREKEQAILNSQKAFYQLINSYETIWPTSSFGNYTTLYYYTVSFANNVAIFSNVFSLNRSTSGSWPYKVDVLQEVKDGLANSYKSNETMVRGYFTTAVEAQTEKNIMESEAREAFYDVKSFLTKQAFGNTVAQNNQAKETKSNNDPWTGKPKLNPESIGTTNDIPKTKKEGDDPWSSENKTKNSNETKSITNQEETKKVNPTIKTNTASDPWSNPVVVESSDKDIKKDDSGRVYTLTEKGAQPKNGMEKFNELIAQNLKYPTSAEINKVEGKVLVEFVVNTDGTITDLNVIKSLPYGCDLEAMRLIKESSPWIPAQNGNMIVRQKMVHPITFKLKQ